MRIAYSILVLLTIALRPMCQLSTLGYYQWNIDTIVEKYCVNKAKPKLQCNGKCYLSKKLTLQQNKENAEKRTITNVAEAFFPVFFYPTDSIKALTLHRSKPSILKNFMNFYFFEFLRSIDAPPK